MHFSYSDTSNLWQYEHKFYYLEYGTDTIFRVSGTSLRPVRVLTGDLKLDIEEHYMEGRGYKPHIGAYVLRNNSGIFESTNHMIFRLFNDYERFFMVYNKKSKQLHRTYIEGAPEIGREKAKKMDTFFDDLFSGLYVNPQYQSMGKAIALVPASDICGRKQEILDFIDKHPSAKSSLLKQIIQEMTDDHNPLMVVITFK